MNTILGVVLLIMNGQIVGAKTTDAYPSMAACNAGVQVVIKGLMENQGPPPQGVTIAKMCVDLTEDLKPGPPKVTT